MRDFWLLAGSRSSCAVRGTNGLIGTHLVSAAFDCGIPEVRAAGLLAVMGVFDLVGTTASGWLSDRFNCRYLLFGYYGLRGISLLFLPAALLGPVAGLGRVRDFLRARLGGHRATDGETDGGGVRTGEGEHRVRLGGGLSPGRRGVCDIGGGCAADCRAGNVHLGVFQCQARCASLRRWWCCRLGAADGS